MQMMELATIAQNSLDVKIILMNNSRLGMVRELQDKAYDGNKTAVFLDGNPDFTALAKAYSMQALKITENDEIDGAIDKMLSHKGAFLLECIIDSNAQTL